MITVKEKERKKKGTKQNRTAVPLLIHTSCNRSSLIYSLHNAFTVSINPLNSNKQSLNQLCPFSKEESSIAVLVGPYNACMFASNGSLNLSAFVY